MIRSSAHVHTTFVDGKQPPAEVARIAHAMGLISLGFCEHGQQPFDPAYGVSEASERVYIDQVRQLKADYAGRMRVWLGIERDQFGLSDRRNFDYIIGSKHYFLAGDGQFAGDGPFDDVAACCNQFFGGDWCAMGVRYFQELADFITTYKPDIIGHVDLISKHNEGGRVYDESDPRYVRAGYEALERMRATDAILEINTGAIARGYRTMPYPALPLLRFWREKGGRVMVNSDCHDAPKLLAAYDLADDLLDAAGYREVWALGTGDVMFVAHKR